MTELIRKEINRIEYFTVDETGESGMSISGLAKWVGMAQNTITDLIKKLSNYPIGTVLPKSLQPLVGKAFVLTVTDTQGRKIVQDTACACIANYYAMDARKTTIEAKQAVLGFTSIGIRVYCQKQTGWQPKPLFTLPRNYVEALKALVESEEQKEILSLQASRRGDLLLEYLPKVNYYDQAIKADGLSSIEEVAKTLNFKGVGRNSLYELLRLNGILMRNNLPYQKYINRGFLVCREEAYNERVYHRTYVTSKGMVFIEKLLENIVES